MMVLSLVAMMVYLPVGLMDGWTVAQTEKQLVVEKVVG